MPKTKEKGVILEKLKYIGLDIKNIPEFLMSCQDLNYNPEKVVEQTEFKTYKYINLKEIQILLTPVSKSLNMVEKYSKAHPLSEYLKIEDILNSDFFAEMLEKLDTKEIEKIEEEQYFMKNNVPFKVEYDTNNLWEIYYSEPTGKYFMLVSTEDANYSTFFYLLKKQIECNKNGIDEQIFVPIKNMDYTKRYLKNAEIADIEKYIWLFTKEWAKVYEVFDKNNELSIHIVGTTNVYEEIKSLYKIELKSKLEAEKFYDFIKDLFILKAELPQHYNFDTQINEKGEISFEFNNKIVNYGSLSKFIKEEYNKISNQLQTIFEEKENTDIELNKLKEDEIEKNKEYLFKEKQVSTYLQCRKSAFGKIKYFFKSKSAEFSKSKNKKAKFEELILDNDIEKSISNSIIETKENYNIQDLIKICIEKDRINLKITNAKSEIERIKENVKNLEGKIQNASLFIQTIEEHKKSIFEFWKFSNRDLPLGLNNATIQKQETKETKIAEDTYIYACSIDKLNFKETKIFYTNPIKAINSIKDEKISLSKIKIKLPDDIFINGEKIEFDISEYKVDLKKQKIFRTNYEAEKFDFKERIVCVYEYEAKLREEK